MASPLINGSPGKSEHREPQRPHVARTDTQFNFLPLAMRAIDQDNIDRVRTLIEMDSFDKESLDKLLHKACERSKDITLEEDSIRNSATKSNSPNQSVLIQCLTARKRNEKMLDILIEAETKVESKNRCRTEPRKIGTPTKPVIKSVDRISDHKKLTTPEPPKLKSSARRTLKY